MRRDSSTGRAPDVPDDVRRRVETARVARLATVDTTGRPHVVPICFAFVGETVYSAVDRKPKRSPRLKRLDNIRANPGVEVVVDHYEDDWSSLWWVRLRGRASVVDDGEELGRALEALAAKYPQYRVEPPPGPVVAVALDRWKWWHG